MGFILDYCLSGLPIKCEHINMYAFTLPLAQMSEYGNVSKNFCVKKQFAEVQSGPAVAFFMCGIWFTPHINHVYMYAWVLVPYIQRCAQGFLWSPLCWELFTLGMSQQAR